MRALAFAIGPIVLATLASSASANWPRDPNNTGVPLCTAAGAQTQQAIASDGAGGAIVAWQDTRGSSTDIYVQRVSAAGVPLWASNGVALCTATGTQGNPVIIPDGTGGAIVAWPDSRTGFGDIYAQRVNAAGVPQWTANGVPLCTAGGDQFEPSIASDGANGAIVTWEDGRSFSTWDVYVQRVNAAGVPQWTANGVALCTTTGDQLQPVAVSDGAGGAIVAWNDNRGGGTRDLYAQRVNATGVPQWAANGIVLCGITGEQYKQMITTDGAGGAIVTWHDNRTGFYDIYAGRVTAAGVALNGGGYGVCTATGDQVFPVLAPDGSGGAIIAWVDQRNGGGTNNVCAQRVNGAGVAQWTSNGVFLAPTGQYQDLPSIVTDGLGGAIVTWVDYRYGTVIDIFAQRVSATGALLWGTYGLPICTAVGDQYNPKIVDDGAGGAIIAWNDIQSGPNNDIYAQRVERFGKLGNPEPTIVNVGDVPGDQGGKINIRWTASYLDVVPSNPIDAYWIWRQVPATAASSALRRGARLYERRTTAGTPHEGDMRAVLMDAQTNYWEFVGSQISHGFPGYSYTTSTLSDSVAAGNPYTLFMVEAEQTSTGFYWDSAADSGYSVDNLAPAKPAPFTGEYQGATTALHWGRNTEPDFALYNLYRGGTPSFVPSPSNRLASQPDTGYVDPVGQPYYYKISAVDAHGNESGFAALLPEGSVGVMDGTPGELSLEPAQPNPMVHTTRLRFELPRESLVRLTVFDQQGRRVRLLVNGWMSAGEHAVRWDRTDGEGRRVPSGVYLCRLDVGGRTMTRRLAAL